ncbi:MAG: glycosyltransferase family 4 protein [Gemmatimonadaceae bacterium]
MTILALSLLLAATGASYLLTGLIRSYALRNAILDRPNERSSHTAPTPRGGGAAIVAVLVASTIGLYLLGKLSIETSVALLGAVPIAFIGWLDDRKGVSPQVRAPIHILSALWSLFWIGGMPTLSIGGSVLTIGQVVGGLLALTGIVWATNLFNFMDGIDGIAGGEAVAISLTGALLLWLAGADGLSLISIASAGAALGFLVWNWSPARIFMGDVGSGALGFWFAVLALASERSMVVPMTLWGLIAGVFVVDATMTVVRRALRRERLHVAHRAHAYQRMVSAGWTHKRVSTAVILINVVLGLLALVALRNPAYDYVIVVGGFVMLFVIYVVVERRSPMA